MNKVISSLENQDKHQTSDRVKEAMAHLEAVRTLRRNRRKEGIDHVELYYKDLDGDWLDQWAEEEIKEESEI